MNLGVIICTYKRPHSVKSLLLSIGVQNHIPDQIIIIDSSEDDLTSDLKKEFDFSQLDYYKVQKKDRGLTRQRNYGVGKLKDGIDLVSFLDDDIILSPNYFQEILATYKEFPKAVGVSGYITNETSWKKVDNDYHKPQKEFLFDGWAREEGSRFGLRKKFGLQPTEAPGFMPDFSHGYSTGFLPPSFKNYKVEMLMGGMTTYKREIFDKITFSPFFEGYGLYEDADFSLRASRIGELYVNTAANLEHHHAKSGRPNPFKYGKMVLRNGWYVWRIKYPHPAIKAKIKWHLTALLLTSVRLSNILTTKEKMHAFLETSGRFWGWISILMHPPRPNKKGEK